MTIEEKLAEMGIELPSPATPLGSYVPVVRTGNLVYVSGQIPVKERRVMAVGSVPSPCTIEKAAEGAKICAINILAHLKAHLGSLDKISKFVRVTGFVQSQSGFYKQPDVINGASDFLVEVFGEKGKHTRVVVGSYELPLDASVEIDVIVEVED